MASITICSDFRAPKNKICHCSHFCPFCLPWSDETQCHDLRFFSCWVSGQLFHSPLSPSSERLLFPLHFLPWEWYHLHIESSWDFSQQSWLQVVIHPSWLSCVQLLLLFNSRTLSPPLPKTLYLLAIIPYPLLLTPWQLPIQFLSLSIVFWLLPSTGLWISA